jgi:hypothetical protein
MQTLESRFKVARWSALACLLASTLALGCRERGERLGQRSDAVSASASAGPSVYGREGLTPLVSALREKAGADPSLLRLELMGEQALVQVEAAGRLGQLVQYQWRGGALSNPVPVELSGKGNLSQNLFPLSSLDLSGLPALIDAAVARIDAEHGKASRVLIRRNLPQDDSVGIRIYVESPLRSSHVDADARGKLLEAGKYP